ncbi:DNA-binding protein [Olivibacter sp. SDN3]|uniref:DNA-binding protein n=1 Tax=Olivibacter sp. SDN3 TaxID=2764720 RepID=UPI00165133C8|nr:DNA-binding protein [Olivibacter sp. SDN3]QNL49159.1 DNA-binding protein [Olivibacter sp. SDN3]
MAQINPAARFSGMGNTGTALQGLSALTSNPAGLITLKKLEVGTYYQAHFMQSDIRYQGAVVAKPTKLGVLGAHVSDYGITGTYSELKLAASFARHFGQLLATAVTVNYNQLRIDKYGGDQLFSVDIGLQCYLNTNWTVGVHMSNVGNVKYHNTAHAAVPAQVKLGTGYRVNTNLLLTADVDKIISTERVDVRAGLEYLPISWISFRGGLAVDEFKQFCGIGLFFKGIFLDMAMVIHPKLGLSPQTFIAYAF